MVDDSRSHPPVNATNSNDQDDTTFTPTVRHRQVTIKKELIVSHQTKPNRPSSPPPYGHVHFVPIKTEKHSDAVMKQRPASPPPRVIVKFDSEPTEDEEKCCSRASSRSSQRPVSPPPENHIYFAKPLEQEKLEHTPRVASPPPPITVKFDSEPDPTKESPSSTRKTRTKSRSPPPQDHHIYFPDLKSVVQHERNVNPPPSPPPTEPHVFFQKPLENEKEHVRVPSPPPEVHVKFDSEPAEQEQQPTSLHSSRSSNRSRPHSPPPDTHHVHFPGADLKSVVQHERDHNPPPSPPPFDPSSPAMPHVKIDPKADVAHHQKTAKRPPSPPPPPPVHIQFDPNAIMPERTADKTPQPSPPPPKPDSPLE